MNPSNLTLTKVLTLLGWRTEPVVRDGRYVGSNVFTDTGTPLGLMTADACWSLLKHRGLIRIEEG